MRGLPPLPDDVVRVTLTVDVSGRDLSTGWWWLIPDVTTGGIPYLDMLAADTLSAILFSLTGCMHAGASLSTCRIATEHPVPLTFVTHAAPNHGAHTGGQADAIATGVYVHSSTGGRGSGSRIRIPGCPDDAVDDNYRLSSAQVSRLFEFANALQLLTNSTTGPTGAPAILGTVQRSAGGVPLGSSSFDPAAGVTPSFRVELLGRRMPRNRWVSPSQPRPDAHQATTAVAGTSDLVTKIVAPPHTRTPTSVAADVQRADTASCVTYTGRVDHV